MIDLHYFANLLMEWWYVLVPLVLISSVGGRKKDSRARVLQVLSRIIGLVVVIIIVLGIFGLLIQGG
jgi:hypothetical protein